ncbi:hypothetical protein FQA39_LY00692 [Lamprigera yunnana]|nr:hypothetical protein FQA39_LY00692 [Lamprigera yunnana]
MASAAQSCPIQDLPPEGGYKPINFQRNPARTVISAPGMILGYFGITGISCFLFYLNNKRIHRLDLERRSAEFAIKPLLMAERDREYLKQLRRNRDAERELMKNVEGWKVGTYYGEPIYKTLPDDSLIEPRIGEYYVHGSFKDFKRRINVLLWS